MLKLLKRFAKEESGQAMVEYGLIIAVVVVVALVSLAAFGDKIKAIFDKIKTDIDTEVPTP